MKKHTRCKMQNVPKQKEANRHEPSKPLHQIKKSKNTNILHIQAYEKKFVNTNLICLKQQGGQKSWPLVKTCPIS